MSVDSHYVVSSRDLKKRYGKGAAAVDALRGVTLNVAPGTFTAIMGPSGSGKSTLMHILAGLDRPTSGDVQIDGQSLDKLDDTTLTRLRRDKVGFVFQSFNLVPVLTAEENIRLPLTLAGKSKGSERVEGMIAAVDLSDRKDHRPAELSGGQQQRVAIARALVSEPIVIFADEPTGNLDSRNSQEIMKLLRRVVDEFGRTIVIVTHDPNAATYADRILFLADGLVVADLPHLTADQIFEQLKKLG